jgi:uncharacterized SAM-binding protein YcdF (DUF218 family)
MRQLAESILLPPLSCLLLAALGLLVVKWRPRLGRCLMGLGFVLLWLMSTPLVAAALLRSLQTEATSAVPRPEAEAIVVLSADADRLAPEYGGSTVGALGLQRLRYGAALHRATGKPILVTGGVPSRGEPPHAVKMKEVLESDFDVPVRWVEPEAKNTHENARLSAEMLRRDGIGSIYLVTHAWHMPRAQRVFEKFGLAVTPAPTGYRAAPDDLLTALVPRWTALRDTAFALHEMVGAVWYAIST